MGGRSARFLWEEKGQITLHVGKRSHACCRSLITWSRAAARLWNVSWLCIFFLWTRMSLQTSPASFCSLSNPARTTLMTSAVKTERLHLLHALSYGGSPEADVGEGGVCSKLGFGGRGGGGSRCLVRRKLNNFKVHLVKLRMTYFNTSFTLSCSLLVGVPPLYVCLRQCERAKVCVILRCISVLLHLGSQRVSCWGREYWESGAL